MEHSGFPSDETLAAFIDGRLDDVTRRRVIEHMTSCDECYSVYLAATEMQKAAGAEPPRRRILPRHFWAATLSMSMAAVLAVVLFLRPDPGIDHLVVASGNLEYRSVEGRLSGFDAYRPLQDTERATPADVQKDSEKWELLDVATDIKKAAKKKPNAKNLHALGVAHLLLGNWDEAIDTLKKSDRKRPNDAAVLNDLATAYLARATYKARPSDYVEAAERAKRAWELKQTPEIAWTRAVAFEHLHERTMARAAWNDYLELDDQSPWRGEAETRIHDLGAPTDAQKWKTERPLFERAVLHGDAAEIARIADAFPPRVAEFSEEKLTEWAKGGDAASFDAAERAGAAVAGRGFGYLQDACVAVRAASPAQVELTKQAIRELERGLTLSRQQRFSAAHEALASARELALRARSPIAQRALLQLAGCTYNENDYPTTTKLLDALSKEIAPSAIVFRARIGWLRGLILIEGGHPDDGLRSYLSAAELIKPAGHRDFEAALNAMIGQSYQILGKPDQAWEHRLLALNLAMKAGDPGRVQYVLMESTIAAVFYERRHELSDLLTGRLLAVSHALKKNTAIADAHIWRARYLRDSGESNAALDELRSARQVAGAIADKDSRERLMANLELAEGELLARDEPKVAVVRLTESLRFLDRSGNHLLRAQAYSARAGAYETVRDLKNASLDRKQGIAEVEAQRERISNDELRTAFVAVARRLYTEEIDMAVASGDYARAFDLAERSRATTAGVAPAVTLERLRQVLPVGVALVEYAALPERTVAWIVRREGVTATILPSDGKAVSAAAERLIAARTDRRSFDVAAADLYTRILAPLRPQLSSISTIVFVSEPTWTRFPFAALLDPSRKRFLFEDVDVANAPSASRLVAVIAAAARPRGPENVLVYSDPGNGNAPRLAAAQREGDLVGRTFPGATVISGNDATRDNFLARARFATHIHFAGHARDDALNGDYSALVFSDGRGDSGLLYAWEVRELDLSRTRLVVLSACGTDAISDAFLAAGAPATIATLWNIGDAHGRELMFELYGRLHDGASPSHALRAAQLAVMQDPGSRPADWAGFELVGL
jgi:tetratricopeptide (TPR) repeat protein